MPYTFFRHRHKFAVWAAARATQRNWKGAKGQLLLDAIEHCGLKEFAGDPRSRYINRSSFDQLHKAWCNSICRTLKRHHVPDVGNSYGRVAKLVAVYLKSMLILQGPEHCSLAQVAHPPIDRTLLQNLAGSDPHHNNRLRRVSWTKLNKEAYYELIDELRRTLQLDQPFWKLEEHWEPTAKS